MELRILDISDEEIYVIISTESIPGKELGWFQEAVKQKADHYPRDLIPRI